MQYRKLSELKKLEGNPRVIRDKQFKALCNSIRDNPEYFEARPLILSNRTGEMVIIAGNMRYEAARSLKLAADWDSYPLVDWWIGIPKDWLLKPEEKFGGESDKIECPKCGHRFVR